MSSYEIFHGYFEKFDLDVADINDEDYLYDLEKEHKCYFVNVDDQLYKVWSSDLYLSYYGFSEIIEPSDKPQLLLYWYNGGAGIREVAEEAIKKYLKKDE
jgi:hypothetical protein